MGKRPARQVFEYDSMADFEADGGLKEAGNGEVKISGIRYLVKDESIKPVAPILTRPTYITIGDSIMGRGNQSSTVTSITCSNGIATVVHTSHGLVTNCLVNMNNVEIPSLCGIKKITVVNENTYTYPCDTLLQGPYTFINNSFVCVAQNRALDSNIIALFNALLGSPLENLGNFGVGGDDSREMLAFHLTAWAHLAPDYVFCVIGINDISVNSITLDDMKSNLISIAEYVLSRGSRLVLMTPMALSNGYTDWVTTRADKLAQFVRWELAYFANYPNVLLVDMYTPSVDPASTTGNWRTGYSADFIHPAKLGVMKLAKHLSTLYANVFPPYRSKLFSLADTYGSNSNSKQLNDNPGFFNTGTGGTLNGASNNANVATGYEITFTGSPTSVTPTLENNENGDGKKQVVTVVANGATQGFRIRRLSQFASRVSPGDKVVLECRVEGTQIDSTFRWLQVGIDLTVGGINTTLNAVASSGSDSWGETFDTVWRTMPFEIPAGLTSLNMYIGGFTNAAGTFTLKLSKCSFEKLP
jgi:lysophospholipase L1-like esterase